MSDNPADAPAPPLFAAVIPQATVIGELSLVADAEGNVIGGVQGLQDVEVPENHWLTRKLRVRRPRHLPGTVLLLAAANGDNYFHWLVDSLPRLRIGELAGHPASSVDRVLLNTLSHPFHDQSLNRLGIPASQRVHCRKTEVLRVERLVVPCMPGPSGKCPAWVRDFLREHFLPATPCPSAGSVYLSRRATRRRRLANELELERALESRGFRIVLPERLSFGEQVKLLAQAECVVAPHGAALANIAFARPGARLVELFHPEHPNGCYRHLAHLCGLRYRGVIGKSTRPRPSPDDRTAEFSIRVEEVLEALKDTVAAS